MSIKHAFAPRQNKPNQTLRRSEFIPTRRQRAGNRTYRPETAHPTINMQNKANFPKAKMNVTIYGDMDYEQKPPLPTPPKQTQFQFPNRRSEFIPTRRERAGNQTQSNPISPHPPRLVCEISPADYMAAGHFFLCPAASNC